MSITFRPITPADEPFLYEVYASTRAAEMAIVPWTDAQKAAFIRMQFNAQHRCYQETYPAAAFLVIVRDGAPVGRLYVDRGEDQIGIVDIAFLPEYRNAGLGSRLLREILDEGDRTGKPVRIHVEVNNPALRLYQRLGFVPIGTNGVYFHLEHPPAGRP